MSQEEQRRPSRPLQIVDEHEQRSLPAHRDQPFDDRVEQPVALGLRIGARRRRKVGHERRDLGQEARELAAVAPEEVRQRAGLDVVDREPQRLDERLVGNPELLLAAAEQHDRTLVMDLSRELRRETGLADAGLTGEEDETGMGIVPGDHLPRRGQLLERVGAAHERELLRATRGRRGSGRSGDRAAPR